MEQSIEISAEQVKRRLDAGEDLLLLDVRELFEWQHAHIDGATHLPMGDIPSNVQQLDPEQPIVVYCHLGVRSLSVTQYLREQDFDNVVSMAGGIEAWSIQVDPAVPRYDYRQLLAQSR